MKIYDKDMYKRQETLASAAIVILAFIIGFFAGYVARQSHINQMENLIQEQNAIIQNFTQEETEF